MKTGKGAAGLLLQRWVPRPIKALFSLRARARLRAMFGLNVYPDLAVRHPLFGTPGFKAIRKAAAPFDVQKRNKPVLERGYQVLYHLARWFADAAVRSAFHVGYAPGRYLFYLSRVGIACGGTDLPPSETYWTEIPAGFLDRATLDRLLAVEFFDLRPNQIRSSWGRLPEPIDVCFSEATFETLLPWREQGVSVPKYSAMDREGLRPLMEERFPRKLAELSACFRSMVFIEPEPSAGGTGAAFDACARQLPDRAYRVWNFRPPLDSTFRLTRRSPAGQFVYAYTLDPGLREALRGYADRVT